MVLDFHDQRDELFNELHTRPFPVIDTQARISQLAVLHAGEDFERETYRKKAFEHLCHPPIPQLLVGYYLCWHHLQLLIQHWRTPNSIQNLMPPQYILSD